MNLFFVKIFPYIAFLGTAVAVVIQGQQVNLVQVLMVLALGISVIDFNFFRISLVRFAPLGWFFLERPSAPGSWKKGLAAS
jgi:hypothetical protein